jgi:hypothetical protein
MGGSELHFNGARKARGYVLIIQIWPLQEE